MIYEYEISVTRVVDGDTLDVVIDLGFNVRLTERIRLDGVDTPETHGPRKEPAGDVAREFVEDWVKAGGKFSMRCDHYNDRGKFGRVLGTIYRDDDPTSLNELLLSTGHARPTPKNWGLMEGEEWMD